MLVTLSSTLLLFSIWEKLKMFMSTYLLHTFDFGGLDRCLDGAY